MRERGNLNEIVVAPGPRARPHYTLMTEHVCPVGALTSERLPLQGARLVPAQRAQRLPGLRDRLQRVPRLRSARPTRSYRYRPRDNEAVNKYWMCDDGMLDYRRVHEGRVLERARRAASAATLDGGARRSRAKRLKGANARQDRGRAQRAALATRTTSRSLTLAKTSSAPSDVLRRRAPARARRTTSCMQRGQEPEHARRRRSSRTDAAAAVRASSSTAIRARQRHARDRARLATPRTGARRGRARASVKDAGRASRRTRARSPSAAHVVLPASQLGRGRRHVREPPRAWRRRASRRSRRRATRGPRWELDRASWRARSATRSPGRSSPSCSGDGRPARRPRGRAEQRGAQEPER